ncbi:hypothetical protein VOLCADRAFT_86031 [Volvox carteri f. nagariensis]|uniref:Uncharacterized protein n=1 Tax=Volvox carteri f. nagariensis TaxID=3068 RepID=D8THN3_VOLCA|nr:uncharacterized protein VOLCADRAFT_86031 [Volvox carteri f. nagariensis]EFJ52744.1 hypothetical protein VOLCADRAFT_86031 [Volvox carteri f. nagariensis]|eukprot:XP_002945749.1 hypothetical protein VOLCADRAFT_86031 [Volvox carteri f. nagariensis]
MSESIVDQLADAANSAGQRIKETFGAEDTQGEGRSNMQMTSGGGDRDKDRTQTSASEDAHDLASAAEDKTNEVIDRAREAAAWPQESIVVVAVGVAVMSGSRVVFPCQRRPHLYSVEWLEWCVTTQDMSQRADDAYKGTKGFVADESEKARSAMDDMKTRAAESVPGRDTQDPQVTSETGQNAGYEAARDMSEKVEDVLGMSA